MNCTFLFLLFNSKILTFRNYFFSSSSFLFFLTLVKSCLSKFLKKKKESLPCESCSESQLTSRVPLHLDFSWLSNTCIDTAPKKFEKQDSLSLFFCVTIKSESDPISLSSHTIPPIPSHLPYFNNRRKLAINITLYKFWSLEKDDRNWRPHINT